MSPEGVYRRLARLFPREWRDRNEDEFVSTLRDAAGPPRRSFPLADTLSLLRLAFALRFRGLSAQPTWSRMRATARVAGLVVLALTTSIAGVVLIRSWTGRVSVEFLLTSLVVVVVPGTGVVYTVSSSIAGGWRRGLFAAIGCTFGIVPHVLAALLGLSWLMQTGAVAFEAVRWLGVGYLVFMGLTMIRADRVFGEDRDQSARGEATSKVIRRGILLNLLNPKLTVFFFAFLPQFLDARPGLLDARLIGLAAVFMLMTLVVFVLYAWTSAIVRERVLRAPGVVRWVQRSLGALLIGLAARLAVTDR
jgi:threonine/homoserine/homoserine lactone efflux protein